MFQTACGLRELGGWEIQPSEFWKMTTMEWWWLYDINVGQIAKEEQETTERLRRILRESKAQEAGQC